MDIEFKISKNPVNYKKALMFLDKRVELVKQGGKELVWLLEHPLTYSAGIRSKKEGILDKSITVIKTNRGGKITLHNPGQQIVYFVLNLNKRKKDIRNLVRQIENIIIKFLNIYKVKSSNDCVLVNQYGKGKVFGTTLGHHNETMQAKEYLNMVSNGILWATDRIK